MKTVARVFFSVLVFSPILVVMQSAQGAISAGLLSDFEDGTTQGWAGGASPTNISFGGPLGKGDNFLQVGNGGSLATYNTSADYSGMIDLDVISFQVDLMRPSADASPLDMRLVLFGPGTSNRWTSTKAAVVLNDDVWRTYNFSLLEADLTQVDGTDTYANLVANVNRVMFRHDPGSPSGGGTPVPGTLGIDNVIAIPEPTTVVLLLAGLGLQIISGRRRRGIA